MGTQPFGVDKSEAYAANDYFDAMDREVESRPGAMPKKFGVISYNEKLASLEKYASLHRNVRK